MAYCIRCIISSAQDNKWKFLLPSRASYHQPFYTDNSWIHMRIIWVALLFRYYSYALFYLKGIRSPEFSIIKNARNPLFCLTFLKISIIMIYVNRYILAINQKRSLPWSLCILIWICMMNCRSLLFKIPGKKISLTKAWSQRDLFDNTNIVMYNKHREAVSWS